MIDTHVICLKLIQFSHIYRVTVPHYIFYIINNIKTLTLNYTFQYYENNNFIAHTKNQAPFYCLWSHKVFKRDLSSITVVNGYYAKNVFFPLLVYLF